MAPEIILKTGYNQSVDIWALGILMYEMCTGVTPFHATSMFDIQTRILKSKVAYASQAVVSPSARGLIGALLTKSPQDRLLLPGIRKHVFFGPDFNWTHVYRQLVEFPIAHDNSQDAPVVTDFSTF
jgi:serum/glucocorticoid-regulated kinase 2